MVTIREAIKKSPILLPQYLNLEQFYSALKLILHIGTPKILLLSIGFRQQGKFEIFKIQS